MSLKNIKATLIFEEDLKSGEKQLKKIMFHSPFININAIGYI